MVIHIASNNQNQSSMVKMEGYNWYDMLPQNANKIRWKVYQAMARPVMIYGQEVWTLRRKEEELLERTEMGILRWALRISLKERKGMSIWVKIREARPRWYGSAERVEEENVLKEA